jgi:predicted signal transduction protein with EAL and GGDEF domain
LQDAVAAITIEVRPGRTIRLAASAGAAVFPHDGTTSEALIADADSRMYRDKTSRRRPAEVHPSPAGAEFMPDTYTRPLPVRDAPLVA